MKTSTLTLCAGLLFGLVSCEEEPVEIEETCFDGIKNQDEVETDCGGVCESCAIEYPVTGLHGDNFLFGEVDTLYLNETEYSLKAIVPVGSSLKIELHLLSGEDAWGYNPGSNVGWSISSFNHEDDMQTFEALNPGTCEVKLAKWGGDESSLSALIKYFENGAVESNRRVIIWN